MNNLKKQYDTNIEALNKSTIENKEALENLTTQDKINIQELKNLMTQDKINIQELENLMTKYRTNLEDSNKLIIEHEEKLKIKTEFLDQSKSDDKKDNLDSNIQTSELPIIESHKNNQTIKTNSLNQLFEIKVKNETVKIKDSTTITSILKTKEASKIKKK